MSLFGTAEKDLQIGGATITIRRLSRKELREIDILRAAGSPDVDGTALLKGVVRWSIDKPLTAETFDEMDPTEHYALVMGIMRHTNGVSEAPEKETPAPSPGVTGEGAVTA